MKDIITEAKKKTLILESLKRDKKVRAVMSFFIKKGLLISNCDFGKAPKQIKAEDCLFVAKNFEPRIFAVLPAALIHFKNAVINKEKLPEEILRATKAILDRKYLELQFAGIDFREMQYWASKELADRRVRPVGKKKIVRTFRIAPEVFEKLEKIAKEKSYSLTMVLEKIVREF